MGGGMGGAGPKFPHRMQSSPRQLHCITAWGFRLDWNDGQDWAPSQSKEKTLVFIKLNCIYFS